MLKIFGEAWGKYSKDLKEHLYNNKNCYLGYDVTYKELLIAALDIIYNAHNPNIELDINHITVIDNGDYQGTLLFIIPCNMYQPSIENYLYTYVDYGSCSGCDALLYATSFNVDDDSEVQKGILCIWNICCHLISHLTKLAPNAWDSDDGFEEMDWDV